MDREPDDAEYGQTDMLSVVHRSRYAVAWLVVVVCSAGLAACDSDGKLPAAAPSTVPAATTAPGRAVSSASPAETAGIAAPSTVPAATTAPGRTATSPPPAQTATAAIVDIIDVYDSVEFYPACGNETLDHEGVTWYPLVHVGFDPIDPGLQRRVDEVLAVHRKESPVTGVRGLLRVAPPGPGDGIGTLVVWEDGVARWVSESQDLDVWMIDDEIVYTWVC